MHRYIESVKLGFEVGVTHLLGGLYHLGLGVICILGGLVGGVTKCNDDYKVQL